MDIRRLMVLTRSVPLFLVFVVGTSVGVAAQPTVSLRGNVGATFFQSPEPTSQVLNSGTNFGVEAGIRVYEGIALTLGGGYSSFTLNEANARIYSQGGGDLSFLNGSLGLRYTFSNESDAHPYLKAGVGIYRGQSSDRKRVTEDGQLVDASDQVRITEEGVHVGVGSLFRLDETYAVFVEPRYVFFDLSQGLNNALRYFTLRLGVDMQL